MQTDIKIIERNTTQAKSPRNSVRVMLSPTPPPPNVLLHVKDANKDNPHPRCTSTDGESSKEDPKNILSGVSVNTYTQPEPGNRDSTLKSKLKACLSENVPSDNTTTENLSAHTHLKANLTPHLGPTQGPHTLQHKDTHRQVSFSTAKTKGTKHQLADTTFDDKGWSVYDTTHKEENPTEGTIKALFTKGINSVGTKKYSRVPKRNRSQKWITSKHKQRRPVTNNSPYSVATSSLLPETEMTLGIRPPPPDSATNSDSDDYFSATVHSQSRFSTLRNTVAVRHVGERERKWRKRVSKSTRKTKICCAQSVCPCLRFAFKLLYLLTSVVVVLVFVMPTAWIMIQFLTVWWNSDVNNNAWSPRTKVLVLSIVRHNISHNSDPLLILQAGHFQSLSTKINELNTSPIQALLMARTGSNTTEPFIWPSRVIVGRKDACAEDVTASQKLDSRNSIGDPVCPSPMSLDYATLFTRLVWRYASTHGGCDMLPDVWMVEQDNVFKAEKLFGKDSASFLLALEKWESALVELQQEWEQTCAACDFNTDKNIMVVEQNQQTRHISRAWFLEKSDRKPVS